MTRQASLVRLVPGVGSLDVVCVGKFIDYFSDWIVVEDLRAWCFVQAMLLGIRNSLKYPLVNRWSWRRPTLNHFHVWCTL